MKSLVITVRGALLAATVAVTTVLAATNASAAPVVLRVSAGAARAAGSNGSAVHHINPDCLACVGLH